MTLTTQTIPLNLLIQSKANVRRTGRNDSVADLAASIAAHGLRQNLNVRPTEDGRFEVVAGGRRLRALKLLAKEKRLAKDAPIACIVLAPEDNPAEISLVENTLRVAMHPDDQCTAFLGLIEGGTPIEDVAARFGVAPAVVRQRLRLANVAPALRALYRKGEMTLDHMQALAISDDHDAQLRAWQGLSDWNRDPERLREALTGETIPASNKLARCIGIETYEAAGGTVLRDLFDAEGGGYLTDRALVQRLVDAKLAEAVATVRAEGWKWAIAETSRDYATPYGRVYPQPVEDEDALAYAPEDMARAGARVLLEHDGSLSIQRGLVHPDDMPNPARGGDGGAPKNKPDPAALPAGLVKDLTLHRTAAMRVELLRNPAVALAATVHALALPLLYRMTGSGSCLCLRGESSVLDRQAEQTGESPAHAVLAEEAARWGDRLPGDPDGLFGWCLAQPQDVLLDLLAFLAALTVDAVQAKEDRPDAPRLAHADTLAEVLALDMRQWWTPSVDGFYARLTKATLIHAIKDAGRTTGVVISNLKKADAARYVAGLLANSGWLPVPLRGKAAETPIAEAA